MAKTSSVTRCFTLSHYYSDNEINLTTPVVNFAHLIKFCTDTVDVSLPIIGLDFALLWNYGKNREGQLALLLRKTLSKIKRSHQQRLFISYYLCSNNTIKRSTVWIPPRTTNHLIPSSSQLFIESNRICTEKSVSQQTYQESTVSKKTIIRFLATPFQYWLALTLLSSLSSH